MSREGHFAHFFAREKVGRVGTRNTLIRFTLFSTFPLEGEGFEAPPENPRVNQPRLRGRARQTPPKDVGPRNCFREEEEAQRSEGEVPQGGAARDAKLVPTRGKALGDAA